VRIISDNQQYSPYECTAEEVNIVGACAGMDGRCYRRAVLMGSSSGC